MRAPPLFVLRRQVQVADASGSIFPPNAGAIWNVAYTPSVTLTLSDGLTTNADTSLLVVTATATFGSGVTGVQASDIQVTGAVKGAFSIISASQYTLEINLGATATVLIRVPAASGSVAPPNAASTQFRLLYRPVVTFTLSDGIPHLGTTTLLAITLTVRAARAW